MNVDVEIDAEVGLRVGCSSAPPRETRATSVQASAASAGNLEENTEADEVAAGLNGAP